MSCFFLSSCSSVGTGSCWVDVGSASVVGSSGVLDDAAALLLDAPVELGCSSGLCFFLVSSSTNGCVRSFGSCSSPDL